VLNQHSPTTFRLFALPDIADMRVGQMREELDSYGISTKSFLEKKEIVSALEKARSEGATPKAKKSTGGSSDTSSRSRGSPGGGAGKSREARIADELAKAKSMKVGELKKELKARGISTRSFFEKSEFEHAYAEAVVDGKKADPGDVEEEYDPSYRDVTMRKIDGRDEMALAGRKVIDIQLAK
jgi:predicted HTH domain antitoxin